MSAGSSAPPGPDPASQTPPPRGAGPPGHERRELLGDTLEEITTALATIGEPPYRARQIFGWIYARREADFSRMSDLPAALRLRLAAEFRIERPRLLQTEESSDGTRKHLLEVAGGRIESVLIPERSRATFCISSQIGCALDCGFCLTARMGFRRHLTAGEIVSQVMILLDDPAAESRPVNVLFMGMGEPLHNYEPVLRAFRLLTDPSGVGIPQRRITLSTAGLVPGIRRLAQEPQRPRLAISLNAANDELRSRLMPINRRHPIGELLDAAASYPLAPRERISFEYVLLEGVNASVEDARSLRKLLRRRGLRPKVNLIPFNPGGGIPHRAPSPEEVRRFRDAILASGIPCSIRRNRGREISAACGQLAALPGGRSGEIDPAPPPSLER
jgi:23S rRNA (adenine2503-C2)-methyltransferase